jgi:hypothetical protein
MLGDKRTPEGLSLNVSREEDAVYDDGYLRVEHGKFYVTCAGKPLYNQLPVNGRNFSQLQLLTPGATNTGTGNFNEVRFNSRSNEQNQTKLDGIESTAIWDASPGYLTVQGSQFRLQTSLENIQEFRVDSSNYPAEYGTGTGGQINVIGKSGSNNFHGSVFEYLRNDALDARNFFDGSDKSKLRLNQFGSEYHAEYN